MRAPPFTLVRKTIVCLIPLTLVAAYLIAWIAHPDVLPHPLGLVNAYSYSPPLRPTESQTPLPCLGPRGRLLLDSPDDQVQHVDLDIDYPIPASGSYEEVGLRKTWYSAAGRLGAYGFGEDAPDYRRTRVDWNRTDWAHLQNACLATNNFRFSTMRNVTAERRFTKRNSHAFRPKLTRYPRKPTEGTGRTAFVLRTYAGYQYTQEDFWNMRSLITELALETGGSYAVFLFVDVNDIADTVAMSQSDYDTLLHDIVPPEFRNMTVLWDRFLLRDWYPLALNHIPEWQMYQALQLFSQFYDEFDYYWQWEMDARFTGHAAHYLDALDRFAKAQPRKQALERATYAFIPKYYNSYANLTSTLNASLSGAGHWGPLLIPEIPKPIGPKPPTLNPEADNFTWGVGEDADAIVLSKSCLNVTLPSHWVYRDWTVGFEDPELTPRLHCPPAMNRASWNLLAAVHDAQISQGLSVPSEATVPSFALWHGLKFVRPPWPWFYEDPNRIPENMDRAWNGGPPGTHNETDGMAHGVLLYHPEDWPMPGINDFVTTTTWGFQSQFVPRLLDAWYGNEIDGANRPWLAEEHGREILLPNLIMHPRKSSTKKEDKDAGE